MRKITDLFKKEIAFYFNSPTGYIIAVLFAVFANFLFVKDLFLRGTSSMRPFFDLLPWLLLIFIPAISMRIFAEERRTNTIEVLLTLPVTEAAVVISKFLALLFFATLSLVLTLSLPILLFFISKISVAEIIVSYSGSLLLISLFIALSMLVSSLAKSQVVAFLSAVLVIFVLLVLGGEFLTSVIPRFIHENITVFSPLYHYNSFLRGLIDLRSAFYFVSGIVMLLFFTVINIEKRD